MIIHTCSERAAHLFKGHARQRIKGLYFLPVRLAALLLGAGPPRVSRAAFCAASKSVHEPHSSHPCLLEVDRLRSASLQARVGLGAEARLP